MIYSIYFIGGIRDGETIAARHLPEVVDFPAVIDWSVMRGKSKEEIINAPVILIRYRRLADTCNYVCMDWNKL